MYARSPITAGDRAVAAAATASPPHALLRRQRGLPLPRARRSPCCSSRASTCSASRGCGSPRRRSSSRCGGARGGGCARSTATAGACCWRWGVVLAVMNCCFYLAIDRLPLGTVAAIEFLPVIALAALGARSPRNARARARRPRRVPAHRRAARGRAARRRVRLRQRGALRALHRARPPRRPARRGSAASTGWRRRCSSPSWRSRRWAAGRSLPALIDPVALLAGIGVGVCSSVIPYVADQLAMARLTRASYALMVSLLPATATVIGIVVLGPGPVAAEVAGVALVIAGVALHQRAGGRGRSSFSACRAASRARRTLSARPATRRARRARRRRGSSARPSG